MEHKTIRVVAAVIKKDGKIFAAQRGYGEYKGWWEFPGGKIEPGEEPREALKREILEELDTRILVGDLISTVKYEYPSFHLSMDCYWCEIESGNLDLREHENSGWFEMDNIESIEWLPADRELIKVIKGE